jgi:hypothetical protein
VQVKSRWLSCHGCEVSVATLTLQRKLAICSHCQASTFYLWRNILLDSGWKIEPQTGNFEASREALLHGSASLAEHCRVSTGRVERFDANDARDILLSLAMDAEYSHDFHAMGYAFLLHLQILCLRLGRTCTDHSLAISFFAPLLRHALKPIIPLRLFAIPSVALLLNPLRVLLQTCHLHNVPAPFSSYVTLAWRFSASGPSPIKLLLPKRRQRKP